MAHLARPLELTEQQRASLQVLVESPGKRLARRAAIVLAVSAVGMSHAGVATQFGTVGARVRHWRKRFEARE